MSSHKTSSRSGSSLDDKSLIDAIVAVTRPPHAKLNRLIINRLPLALPPRAPDASIYVSGLLYITPIYMTFETLWDNVLRDNAERRSEAGNLQTTLPDETFPMDPDDSSSLSVEDSHDLQHDSSHRIHQLLQRMHLPDLWRTERLKADIRMLTGWQDCVIDEQLLQTSRTGQLGEFVKHISDTVHEKPHVLLAYSYIMFMALFAGGRYIRASFESVGCDFWSETPSPVKPSGLSCRTMHTDSHDPAFRTEEVSQSEGYGQRQGDESIPLQFFYFPAASSDGDDLKREFKRRLLSFQDVLTKQERHDILHESVCIFEHMILLITQLDQICGMPLRGRDSTEVRVSTHVSQLPLIARLRDSVAVAKQRSMKATCRSPWRGDSSPTEGLSKRREQAFSKSAASGPNSMHPAIPGHVYFEEERFSAEDMDLCPGLSKSVKFEASLPTGALPSSHASAGHVVPVFKVASKHFQVTRATNLVLMAAFGIIVISAYLGARWSA